MSGHSKWAQIKHKKAATDAQKGKLFTKIIREITVAARQGGGDPEGNSRLRAAIIKAKAANMPADTIKRAIQKGTGELPEVHYEEVVYEGYGPGRVAIMLEVMTDNKKRTAAEIRSIFSKHGGNLGETGCVSWLFQKKGLIVVDKDKASEEELMGYALDAGAEDFRVQETTFEIVTQPQNLEKVKEYLLPKGVILSFAEVTMLPQTTVKLTGREAEQTLRLMEALEDHDDVQHVYANFDIPDEIMAKVG